MDSEFWGQPPNYLVLQVIRRLSPNSGTQSPSDQRHSLHSGGAMASSGINFSGFNGIDFGLIIDSIIKQESQPLENTQKQQKVLQDKDSTLTQLGSQIADLE